MEIRERVRPITSVVLPSYNRAHLIGRAIRSVLAQTYPHLELIVVDDCSTDNTEELVRGMADPRVRFVRQAEHMGAPATRNTGIKTAIGEYIAFIDSDDEWFPQKLERQLAVFKRSTIHRLGMVVCDVIVVQPNGKETVNRPQMNGLTYEGLIFPAAHGVATGAFLVKRDFTEPELHFDESLPALQDWEFMLRLSRLCNIGYAPESLIRQDWHDGPRVHTVRNVVEAHSVIRRKYAAELAARPRALGFSHWQTALNYYRLRQMDEVRMHLMAAIRANPWQAMAYPNFVASHFGCRGFGFFLNLRHMVRHLAEHLVG